MADEIQIPSPSVFLTRTNTPPPTVDPPSRPAHVRRTSAPKPNKKAQPKKPSPEPGPSAKPKQFKSRNGCSTCKQKRLKCDETKPACLQCKKKGLTCGGYKKDFKWRPFEETNVKLIVERQKEDDIPPTRPKRPNVPVSSNTQNATDDRAVLENATGNDCGVLASKEDSPTTTSFELLTLHTRPPSSNEASPQDSASISSTLGQRQGRSSEPHSRSLMHRQHDQPTAVVSPDRTIPIPAGLPIPREHLHESSLSPSLTDFMDFDSIETDADVHAGSVLHALGLSESTELDDVDLPGHPSEVGTEVAFPQPPLGDDIDDILWSTFPGAPSSFGSPSDSAVSPLSLSRIRESLATSIYKQPQFSAASPELLLGRFDTFTCGILSMMDGPTENPWRSLIWPMAQQSPALSHAILAMTAFHMSKDFPQYRAIGQYHKQQSIHNIRVGLRDTSIGSHTSIATALALGFTESWDQHTATGNEHIKGAQALVRRALNHHQAHPLQGLELQRLKFLCNAWVYMDVIARLTAVDSNDSVDFDNTFLFPPDSPSVAMNGDKAPFGLNFGMPLDARLDPLMGCASTLFPLIGRVANLVKKVFRTRTTSVATISQANDLKRALEEWSPPSYIDRPQDPSTDPQHTVQTAEAYRWATLLHLHQAVPEIPSPTSEQLAQRVLQFLATVPPTSRTLIVQVYPLMVAGCVVTNPEDRSWVLDRWEVMDERLRLGIVDKSIAVTKEVWRRSDEFEESRRNQEDLSSSVVSSSMGDNIRPGSSLRSTSSDWTGNVFSYIQDDQDDIVGSFGRRPAVPGSSPPTRRIKGGLLPTAYTVRGDCHWVGVMWDWGWQILLG